MKILLGYCVEKEHYHDYYVTLLPLGLISIASYLSNGGYDVVLANFSKKSTEQIIKEITHIKPQLIGFSLFTHNRSITLHIVNKIKLLFPNSVIVLGGPHATFLDKEILQRYPSVDCIVEGEGEAAMFAIIKNIEQGKPPRHAIINMHSVNDVNNIPYPSRFNGTLYNVNVNEQYKYIITSRGCYNNCTFCDSPAFWGKKVRFREVDDVVEELETIYRKYGIIYFSMRDDNFTVRKDRVQELSHKMIRKKLYMMWNCQARVDAIDESMLIGMKKAGLEHIQYGVESGSEKILASYNKKTTIDTIIHAASITRKVGIYLSIYLMVGMKGEDYNDIKKTKKLLAVILPGDCIVSPVALYPGTKLYEDEKKNGAISDSIWFNNNDAGIFLRNEPVIKEWMNELLMATYTLRDKAWYKAKDFVMHKKIVGDCWVTDIMEGDYYFDNELYPEAAAIYGKVIKNIPDNPWGYMRNGKLHFTMGDYETAMESFFELTKIVPNYYGGWLKFAQSCIALRLNKKAKQALDKARQLNPYDERINALNSLLKNNRRK